MAGQVNDDGSAGRRLIARLNRSISQTGGEFWCRYPRGIECGLGGRVHPQIGWVKLRTLRDGAAIASKRLWSLI
jgi:hypothetical protein